MPGKHTYLVVALDNGNHETHIVVQADRITVNEGSLLLWHRDEDAQELVLNTGIPQWGWSLANRVKGTDDLTPIASRDVDLTPASPTPADAERLQLIREAADAAAETARQADTGEDWEATGRYDEVYTVDFKPSVPDPDPGPDSQRYLPEHPDDTLPAFADVAVHRNQALHIGLWHPMNALAVTDLLRHVADQLQGEPVPESHPAVVLARALLGRPQ